MMEFIKWLLDASGETGVGWLLLVCIPTLKRWIASHIVSPLWNCLRLDCQRDYAEFRAMSPKRRTAFTTFLAVTLGPFWVALGMGEAAPLSLQMWVGGTFFFLFGAAGWFAVKDGYRLVRRMGAKP